MCDGWEAMVWVFCQLVGWIMAQKWNLSQLKFPWPAAQKPACYITSWNGWKCWWERVQFSKENRMGRFLHCVLTLHFK
jgi:hypothetical protein